MKILLGSKNFEMQRTSVAKEPKKCANYRTENAEFQCGFIQTKMKDHFGSNANTFHSLTNFKLTFLLKKCVPIKITSFFYDKFNDFLAKIRPSLFVCVFPFLTCTYWYQRQVTYRHIY